MVIVLYIVSDVYSVQFMYMHTPHIIDNTHEIDTSLLEELKYYLIKAGVVPMTAKISSLYELPDSLTLHFGVLIVSFVTNKSHAYVHYYCRVFVLLFGYAVYV